VLILDCSYPPEHNLQVIYDHEIIQIHLITWLISRVNNR